MLVGISGGVADTVDVAVVGIADNGSGATCTGSLIAPNLVLTAQHCVVDTVTPGMCSEATFGAPVLASRFFVTTKPTQTFVPADYHRVSEIRIPPGSPAFCGRDIALLVLADVVAASEAAPIDPRLDPALEPAELYAAVGYGATDDQGTGVDQRRRRDGLSVSCVGDACASTFLGTGEWLGETGICGGDSGGPALDEAGAVVGVASRGSVGCGSPVYTRVDVHAAWLLAEAAHAATAGGYPLPPWAQGTPDPDAGIPTDAGVPTDAAVTSPDAGPATTDSGAGCGCRGSRNPTGLATLLLLTLASTLRRRPSRR